MEGQEARQHHKNDSSLLWHYWALFLSALGFILSIYSVYHYRLMLVQGKTGAFCNINETFNCDAVASSAYSRFLTVPWSVWGSAFYFSVLILLLCSLYKFGNRKEHLFSYTLSVLVGFFVSIGLAYISFVILGAGCIVCIATYAINTFQLGTLFVGYKKGHLRFAGLQAKNYFAGMVNAVIGIAVVLISYNIVGEKYLTETKKQIISSEESTALNTDARPVENIPLALNEYSGLGEDYHKGPENAKIKIVIFSDFECPACKRVSEALEEIYQSYPGKILLVYRNFPLDQACNPVMTHQGHRYACALADLARCAGRFGKFWEFHDTVFAKQADLNANSPIAWAKGVGLSDEQIKNCMADKSIREKISDDISLATRLNISATPSIFINGRRVTNFEEMKDEIRILAGQ